jgi:hypothetical protein
MHAFMPTLAQNKVMEAESFFVIGTELGKT